MKGLSKKERRVLRRIAAAAVLLAALAVCAPLLPGWAWPLYLVPYLIIGHDVLRKAALGVVNGQVFDENFLMALATVGAFGTGEYAEAVFVMLFYQVGELFQEHAVGASRQSIAALMDIRPDTAVVERDGVLSEVDPEDVAVGETVVVKPGERIPLDGVVLDGASTLDTAALTGESVPRDVSVGDVVLSGCVNQRGLLRVKTTKPAEESTVSKILEMVENAGERKSHSENFITRFARYYTPCVVAAAAALFLIPTLLLTLTDAPPAFLAGTGWQDWLHRALVFLVVSCPCALVISVPLSFFGGIGGASRCGILVKGGAYLEALSQTRVVVFDKTGTLTRGVFSVTEVRPEMPFSSEQLLELAALAEQFSDHPISRSLRAACPAVMDPARVCCVEELSGHGVLAVVDGRRVRAGNARLMEREGLRVPDHGQAAGSVVHVAVDGVYAGLIVISDELKPDAAAALKALKAEGVRKTVMLTGDARAAASSAARSLGVDEFHAELLPDQKVALAERILDGADGKVAFVGDGINDAPVLTRVDVGIAMGAMGSDAAIEAADIVLMDDQPGKIALAMRIARKTLRIVHQNIVFALGVKAAVLLLSALGRANLWAAVFADVGVAVLAILNAMRAMRVPAASPERTDG